jgi:hypothetical protein
MKNRKREGRFVDPHTNTLFGDNEQEDVHGTPLIGPGDDGEGDDFWWGTDRAAWVLEDGGLYFSAVGRMRGTADTWDGHFIASSEEQVIDYALNHCIVDVVILDRLHLSARPKSEWE